MTTRSPAVPTAAATIGPFFPGRYVDRGANDLTNVDGRRARGEVIEIRGTVRQDDGTPLHNVIVEVWQADAAGIFRHPADPRAADADPDFSGWGRAATDSEGRYAFRTIRPGSYAMPDGTARAPHVNVIVLASGLMRHLHTVVFFPGDPRNATDPVLCAVEPANLRARLVAREDTPGHFTFDIRLRGEGETPFFED